MTDSGVPPEGFRWVESSDQLSAPSGGSPSEGSQLRRNRRWWVGATATAVVVVLVALLWWWTGTQRGTNDANGRSPAKEAPIGTPQDSLISFSLDRQPVPAWQLSAAEIGLPPQVKVGNLFAAIGQKAFFVSMFCGTGNRCVDPKGWVYGVDTATGARLFPPVQLDGFHGDAKACYTNGPTTAVCVNPDCPQEAGYCQGLERVWVIDLNHGAIIFTGLPQVHSQDSSGENIDEPHLLAVGNYLGETRLVATVKGKGVYGIGQHAELTWFLAGSGEVFQANASQVDDLPPLTLAAQTATDKEAFRVFSVDGKDLTPTPPPGITLRDAQVYNGGFAYEYIKGIQSGSPSAGVGLYDTDGQLLAQIPDAGYPQQNVAMPIVRAGPELQVYTAAGKLVTKVAAGEAARSRIIGTKLYINSGSGDSWQQFDLLTGRPGPICTINLAGSYVGSDGTTVVTSTVQITAETYHRNYVATDTSTCQTRWEIPGEGSLFLWKAGRGLIQANEDTLIGLRPPA